MNPPTTIQNETVKSYGEMDIANFLAQNGIRYLYEHPYEVDTRTGEYSQYCPDFYLVWKLKPVHSSDRLINAGFIEFFEGGIIL